MNLIVDINPYLKKEFKISQFLSKSPIIAEEHNTFINENGINCSRILNIFGVESKILTFLGGITGLNYKNILEMENADFNILKIRDDTQEQIHIDDNVRILNIFSESPRLTNDEILYLYSIYSEEILGKKYVILTNSSSSTYEEELYKNFINIAYKSRVKIGISLNENNYTFVPNLKPYLLVLDKKNLEDLSGTEINFNWESNKILQGLLDNGIAKIIYYNNKGNLQLYTNNLTYSTDSKNFEFNEKNKDRILAGYIASLNRNYDEEMSLAIALATTEIDLKTATFKRDAAEIKMKIKDIKVEKSYVPKQN